MDFNSLLRLKSAWDAFTANHPKFPSFLQAVKDKGVMENMTIDITVTYPDGNTLRSGLRVKESDIALLNSLADMGK